MRATSFLAAIVLSQVAPLVSFAAEDDDALTRRLGPGAPVPIRLWADGPPRALKDAAPEEVDEHVRIRSVSVPTISVYAPPKEKATGRALIICPGGGYGGLDWKTHVVYAAEYFVPRGIAVVGLKYRTRPPHLGPNENIQEIALLDAQRAVRLVRARGEEWGIDPAKIGVAGYSAGANLAMNLACHFDLGRKDDADPIERQSCRPDFVVGMATWHWREKVSPFRFTKDSPPTFLVHATNDGIAGGAPIELPQAIEADLRRLGVPVKLQVFEEGAHGVGNLIPQRVRNGFPPAKWPELMLTWLDEVERR
jgi:acetyl esterase/lipase